MKKLLFITIFSSFCMMQTYGQLTDQNTELINSYFQLETMETSKTQVRQVESTVYTDIVQQGSENEVYINSLQQGDSQVVHQKGSQNNFEFYNYYSNQTTNMVINQEGNLNSVQVFGENSLMKNAIVNQKSNFQSMVIKNYTR